MPLQRAALYAAAVACSSCLVPLFAQQPWLSRPIRLISPYSPGGGNDTLCRIIAQGLTESLGWPASGSPTYPSRASRLASSMPELPTMAEAGVPGYEASLWYGIFGPAHIPPDIVTRLNAEIVRVLSLPAVHEQMASRDVDAHPSTPEAFGKLLAADIVRWAKVVKQVGLQPQ